MAEISLGAQGAGGNWFLPQEQELLQALLCPSCAPTSCYRVVSMITAQPLLQTPENPSGITTYNLGVKPTNTRPGSSQACQQPRLWK